MDTERDPRVHRERSAGLAERAIEIGGGRIPQRRFGGEVLAFLGVAGDARVTAGPLFTAEVVLGALQTGHRLGFGRHHREGHRRAEEQQQNSADRSN
ncbi:MAG: hypothetical protein IIA33_09475 [Planctomycetes bacterium]|nr:hypothetical protein [Planctomycetota bacterium]